MALGLVGTGTSPGILLGRALAQTDGAPVVDPDGRAFDVSRIDLRYAGSRGDRVPLKRLGDTKIELGWTEEGYVSPRAGIPTVGISFDEIAAQPVERYRASAIVAIGEAIGKALRELGVAGAFAIVDPADIGGTVVSEMRDLREDRTALTMLVYSDVDEGPSPAAVQEGPAEQAADEAAHEQPTEHAQEAAHEQPQEEVQEEQEQPPLEPLESLPPAEPIEQDGQSFPVSEFVLVYARPHPNHPPLEQISAQRLKLGWTTKGFVAPREGVPTVERSLDEIRLEPLRSFYVSAIRSINSQITRALNRRGLIGVLVTPSPDEFEGEIGEEGAEEIEDIRDGSTAMTLVIHTALVTKVRSVATGERFEGEQRVDNDAHRRIRVLSPIKPAIDADGDGQVDEPRQDLLDRREVDAFVYRLNRHPGRQVAVAVGPGEHPGDAVLDYLISESKPWTAFFQISNTGTEQTNEYRERFGFIQNQLTNHDDILSLDFVTSGFEDTNAFIGSYEFPFFGSERLRARVYGSWNEFTASDVGLTGLEFEGNGWVAGAELKWNFFQHNDLFLDLKGGARWQHVRVKDNSPGGLTGSDDLFFPYVSVELERFGAKSNTFASVTVEWTSSSISGSDVNQLARLGRAFPDDDWVVLKWEAQHSFYLEPLIFGEAWKDPSTPGSSTLAHEIALVFRGQYAFGNRLIPQVEEVAGGLFSVRGYPESIVAGDTVLVATAEYRLHIPRLLGVNPNPGEVFGRPFRFARQQVYGRPDWDLIFRAFIDVGRTEQSDKLAFEKEETLVGAGVGVELLIKRNLNVRVDWGIALDSVRDGTPDVVSEGSNRFHILATILF